MQSPAANLAAVALGFLVFAAELRAEDAAEHLKKAKEWSEKREYAETIAECDRALEIDPKSCDALTTRGLAWLNKRNYDKAVADFDRALAIDPKFADAYINLGTVLLERGEVDKAIAAWKQAQALRPDDWKILNDLGCGTWEQANAQEHKAVQAEAAGNMEEAKSCRRKSGDLKNDAKALWIRGITINPDAVDIQSNLGYAYSDARDVDAAERHLRIAVRLNPTAPRPRNNLGRVFLELGSRREAEARKSEAEGKTDPEAVAKVARLKNEAQKMNDAAIEQFKEAIRLDPTLTEARLNLGVVHLELGHLEEAESCYKEIFNFQAGQESRAKYGDAYRGLANVAIARKQSPKAIKFLEQSLRINPKDRASLQLMARLRVQRGEYSDGEQALRSWLAVLPATQRVKAAEQFGEEFKAAGKTKEAAHAWNSIAWAFATGSEPSMLDPKAAMDFAKRAVDLTRRDDPQALDTLAAAQAADGHFSDAVETAQAAIKVATAQHDKSLAEAIAKRIELYRKEKPYRSDPDGDDR
jgi:tetratricopeptide (TPR) repeat protein